MTERQASPDDSTPFVPPLPNSIDDTGLGLGFLSNLAMKILYHEGDVLGYELAELMRLPHAGVVDELLTSLKQEKLCEVKGTANVGGRVGLGRAAYRYQITDRGRAMAREAMERSQYVGPAPVPLPQYNVAMRRQPLATSKIHPDELEQALSHLVVDEETKAHLGAAVNSHRSIFLFGPPGNGKTAISEGVGTLVLQGALYIPCAVETGHEVIKVFDVVNHVRDEDPSGDKRSHDQRWVRIRRPVITVGGEMTLAELDLIYEQTSRYYEAPLQMKANGGMLLIDDFGRQQVRPRDLLNRWIVPLEKRTDYLTLHTGRKIQVPFDTLIVFATNLAPKELVDEAFLRRIRHKIEIEDPTWDEYRQIFRRVCHEKQIDYDEEALTYLIKEHYIKPGRPRRGCHPRDLVDQIRDIASYLDIPAELSKELLDQACNTYFVDL
jgi:predicted ATPase with chaperone activity